MLSNAVEDEIVRLYTTPANDGTWRGAKVIARQVGCAFTSVHNVLKRRGIPIRSAKESHAHGKRCKPVKNLPDPFEFAPLCKCGCSNFVAWNQRKNRWNAYVIGHYRDDAAYKDPEWLREAYVDHERSTSDIASEFLVGHTTVIKFMKKFSIDRRSPSEAHEGRQIGENNPAWRGGTTPERQRLYRTQAWKNLVIAVYTRDRNRCVRCNVPRTRTLRLHAHHIASWAEHPDLRLALDNIVSLCEVCHTWVHSRQNVARTFLT